MNFAGLKKQARRNWPLAAISAAGLVALGSGPAMASTPPEPGQGIPFGQQQTGEATYYNDIGTDACGGQIDPTTQPLVAVSHLWFTSADPNDDPLCTGVSVQLTYNGQSITVPVEDECASCDATHIDLSQAVFQNFADLGVGVLSPVTWQFVSSGGSDDQSAPGPSGLPVTTENLVVQPPSSDSGCAAAWDGGTSYVPGDLVSDNGDNWTSTWWSTGAEPDNPSSWAAWTDNGPC
jgi:hypothetical protein